MKPPLPPALEAPTIRRLPLLPPSPSFRVSPRVRMAQYRRIGEAVVAWAKLENCLNDLTWTIQGKNLASGRTATQDLQISTLLVSLQNAMQSHLVGPSFQNERKLIVNLIQYINETKDERNIIVHGTWAEFNGIPVVGSLRADTPDQSLVAFEQYPAERLVEIAKYAKNAISNGQALISRLEFLRGIPTPPRKQD